jgi:hypothetical protein
MHLAACRRLASRAPAGRCGLVALAAILIVRVCLAAGNPATVNADFVHSRSGPGTQHYATGIVRAGDRVEVLGIDRGVWCRVRPPEGSFSWISASAVTLESDGTARVTRDGEPVLVGNRVRDESPSGTDGTFDDRGHAVQAMLRRGDAVRLLQDQPRPGRTAGASWYKIASPPGEVRWIHQQYLVDAATGGGQGGVTLASYTQPQATAPAQDVRPVAYQESVAVTDAPVPVAAPIVYVAPPATRHFVTLEALGWWVKGDSLPALVTTSPIGTPQTAAGILGLPTTSVLFGNEKVNDDIRPGGRVQGGIWLDPAQTFAVEGHYWGLATETTTFFESSTFGTGSLDDRILARPFFNVTPGVDQPDARIIAFPDFIIGPLTVDIDGSIKVKESSRVQSAGGGGRYALSGFGLPARFFLLGGYRFFDLDESLSIKTSSNPGTDPFPFPVPPGHIEQFDGFATQNTFNGGEVGLGAEVALARWTLAAETRLAMGNMHQTLDIDGLTSAVSGPYVASFPGGLLAQPTNIGSYSRNRFALIPQVDVRLKFQVLPATRLTVGYNFTYVTNVLRPGDQVDTSVNETQIAGLPLVGPARPAATLNETDIWLQGVSAGLDFTF